MCNKMNIYMAHTKLGTILWNAARNDRYKGRQGRAGTKAGKERKVQRQARKERC